jgi:hypothetical protein
LEYAHQRRKHVDPDSGARSDRKLSAFKLSEFREFRLGRPFDCEKGDGVSSSGVSSWRSSSCTARDTAGWLIRSCAAARLKLPASATAENARTRCKFRVMIFAHDINQVNALAL